ncbi:MAG: hypothetical protein P1U65_14245 [Minwuia sp.]|nr:hypothetical protein [Minwuia sp.]
MIECKASTRVMKGVFKIWPDKGAAVRPYRTRAEAIRSLVQSLAREAMIEVFYCGRAANSCALIELPKPEQST